MKTHVTRLRGIQDGGERGFPSRGCFSANIMVTKCLFCFIASLKESLNSNVYTLNVFFYSPAVRNMATLKDSKFEACLLLPDIKPKFS